MNKVHGAAIFSGKSSTVTGLLLAAALVASLGAPLSAQTRSRAGQLSGDPTLGADPTARSNLIPALDVQEKNLIDVTRYIEETANVNILVDEALRDIKITLHLTKALSWLDTLKVVADEADADMRMVTEDTVRLFLPPRVALEFRDAPVKDAIRTIARVSGKNIVIPSKIEEVNDFITLNLRNVPWDDALDVVVKSAGLVAVPEGGGRVIRIAHPDDLLKQLETKIYRLRFMRPRGEYKAIFSTGGGIGTGDSGGGGGGGGRTFVERTKVKEEKEIEDRFPLLKALKKALTVTDNDVEIGKLDYDEITNTLIVRDQQTILDDIGRIIAEIDEEPNEVQIDIKFIDTQNTDMLDFGVDIFSDGLSVTGGLGAFVHRLPFNLGEGGWEDSLQVGETPGPIPLAGDGGYQFGTLDFSGVNAALRILKRDVHSRLVQSPKIVAIDGRPATIFVGDEIRFAESEAIVNDLGAPTVTIAEATNSPVQVGFQLLVIPYVIRGTNKIKLTVIPANTALTGPFNGFDIFRVGEATLSLPRLTSATVVTQMVVQNGQTAVIGGLLSENESNTVNKVPLLGDLPVIGYAFKNRVTNSERNNLIIFVTPRIIRDYEQTEEYLEKYIDQRVERHAGEVEELTGRPYIAPVEEEETPPGAGAGGF